MANQIKNVSLIMNYYQNLEKKFDEVALNFLRNYRENDNIFNSKYTINYIGFLTNTTDIDIVLKDLEKALFEDINYTNNIFIDTFSYDSTSYVYPRIDITKNGITNNIYCTCNTDIANMPIGELTTEIALFFINEKTNTIQLQMEAVMTAGCKQFICNCGYNDGYNRDQLSYFSDTVEPIKWDGSPYGNLKNYFGEQVLLPVMSIIHSSTPIRAGSVLIGRDSKLYSYEFSKGAASWVFNKSIPELAGICIPYEVKVPLENLNFITCSFMTNDTNSFDIERIKNTLISAGYEVVISNDMPCSTKSFGKKKGLVQLYNNNPTNILSVMIYYDPYYTGAEAILTFLDNSYDNFNSQ